MINSKYNWEVVDAQTNSQLVSQIVDELSVSELIAKIMVARGIKSVDEANHFLNPDVSDFNDPFEFPDMQKAIERIQTAIANEEQITVYGDYDADGITSTTIMYETIEDLGGNVDFYVPNRFTDGYGPNDDAFKRIIDDGTTLIITVDNGVAGNDSIKLAKDLGCDVIITDHHDLPEVLPDAFAIIHPRVAKDGAQYSFGMLSGAGVAFKVATALLEEIPYDLLDIAAIGTVADVVSLTGENRAIVSFGIQAIKNTQRPGLSALLKQAGTDIENFDEQDIGFAIAPRLNSLGRMGDAKVGVNLLHTFDEDEAQKIAKFADQQNDERKDYVADFFDKSVQMLEKNHDDEMPPVIVVVGQDWHQGVLGIVASRLVDKYQRPAIVMTTLPDSDEVKGSGRSISDFDLFAAINPIRDQMVGFGGHHSAVGLTIKSDKVADLRKQLEVAANEQGLDLTTKQSELITASVNVDSLDNSFYKDLRKLAPFGEDNPQPVFEFKFDQLVDVKRIGQDSSHLKFAFQGTHKKIGAIAFQMGDCADDLVSSTASTKVIGEIGVNTWRNRTNLQIMVEDIQQISAPIVDLRTNQLHKKMFSRPGTYVFFHESIMKQLMSVIPETGKPILYTDLIDLNIHQDTLFVVDCPDSIDDLTQVLDVAQPDTTVFYLYKKQMLSKIGMPERQSYAKLFKFVSSHHDFDIVNQRSVAAKALDVSERTLAFMVKVFLELGFVSKSGNQINLIDNPESKNLQTAPSYQLREKQIDAEQHLLLANTRELVSFISQYLEPDERKKLNGN
ncbi:single-stranded-DNA-specific exonuclease RecJ [Lentilactobacillus curieae]|uniref:Single-stranded-DNA-specific exonuclease RecJ n=1 Tax=Lentilactobacillus curieae TaxID=1138822 RepID=A0A1S6QFW9_9LACO|nr:single-stranded-DNA-specific exonuclease RecJ [Lentilactobacillus curieae]AQW20506.1 single-stranded-DNA-specific exonuclease RecJ [Lentilactobacillus curieae]